MNIIVFPKQEHTGLQTAWGKESVSVDMEEKEFNYKAAIFVALAIVLLLVVLSLTRSTPRVQRDRPARVVEGGMAPEFTLPGLDGKMVSLRENRGKVVFINIWATWCTSCLEEMPSMEKLYKALGSENFEILAVSIDENGARAVAPFMKKYGLTFPALMDAKGSIKFSYGITGVPETFVIDKNGVVVMKFLGPTDWATPDALRYFRKLIQRPAREKSDLK